MDSDLAMGNSKKPGHRRLVRLVARTNGSSAWHCRFGGYRRYRSGVFQLFGEHRKRLSETPAGGPPLTRNRIIGAIQFVYFERSRLPWSVWPRMPRGKLVMLIR